MASSLSAFSDEVAAVERDGLVDKDAAKRLDDVVRDIERALRDDDPEKVAEEADKLVEEYDKAVQEGAIPSQAATRLDPLLQDVTDTVDAYAG